MESDSHAEVTCENMKSMRMKRAERGELAMQRGNKIGQGFKNRQMTFYRPFQVHFIL